jgi:hypothetical protein
MIDTPFLLFIGSDKLLPLIPARAMFSVTVRTVAEARKTWDQWPHTDSSTQLFVSAIPF